MNKSELIDVVVDATGFSKADAARATDAVFDAITDALCKDESVTMIGFGTFSVRERAARKGRNPQTGAEINIAFDYAVRAGVRRNGNATRLAARSEGCRCCRTSCRTRSSTSDMRLSLPLQLQPGAGRARKVLRLAVIVTVSVVGFCAALSVAVLATA